MSSSQTVTEKLAEAKTLEDKGRYEQAFQLLGPFWDEVSQFPNVLDLNAPEAAELFLRFGGVIGFIGNAQQMPDAQEISKNLLSLARQRFLKLDDVARAAECENYLALSYSRTGEFTEAFDYLTESLARGLPEGHPARIHAYVVETLLLSDARQYAKLLRRGLELREIFDEYGDDTQKGCFYNHLSLAYKNLGDDPAALDCLKKARRWFKQAGHEIFYGATENNLALYYTKKGFFDDAHQCAQNAREIFEQIGDRVREGYSLETRAQIFLAERKPEKALNFVNSAIDLLETGDSYRKLVECYRTKIGILLALGRFAESLTVMIAAHNIAALYISPDLSREIIETVAALIEEHYIHAG